MVSKILCSGVLCYDFVSKYFCLTVPKSFVREFFCARFQKIPGSEKFYEEEGGARRGGKEYQEFRSKSCYLTKPKNIFQEFVCAVFQKKSPSEKVCGQKGRGTGYHEFPSKVACLTVLKNFVGYPFSLPLTPGIEKLYSHEGYVKIT